MRKSYALLVLIPFGILAACEESESDGGPNLLLDGGQPVLDGGELPPPPPPPVDAGDAGPLPVSVTVTNAAGPEANVPVVFQDATGSVIATVMTSAGGLAAQVVPAGSQVTVVMGTAFAPHLLTITEVAPGDMLAALDLPASMQLNTSVVSVPSGGPANATLVANIGDCAGGYSATPPLDVSISPTCHFAGTFPVLVTAYDESSEVGFTYKKSNQYWAPDGGEQLSVDVTQPWSTAFNAQTVAVTNVPASQGVTTVFSEVASGIALSQQGNVYNQGPAAGSFETQHRGHTGYPDFVQSEILVRRSHDGGYLSLSAIATRTAAPTGDATTSFNYVDLLPHVDPTTIDETTRERPSVTWKAEEGKSFDTADGAYVYLAWYIAEGEGYRYADWTLVTPANRTSVKAPQLPANLTQFAPPPNEDGGVNMFFQSPAAVTIVEGAAINGYTDFRKISAAVPAAAAMKWSYGERTFIPPLPAAGTLRASAYTRSND